MKKKAKLKFFADEQGVLAYLTSELLATLRDDLGTMEREERQHYTNDDRKEMKAKIHDLEMIEHKVLALPGIVKTLQRMHDFVSDAVEGGRMHEDDHQAFVQVCLQSNDVLHQYENGRTS